MNCFGARTVYRCVYQCCNRSLCGKQIVALRSWYVWRPPFQPSARLRKRLEQAEEQCTVRSLFAWELIREGRSLNIDTMERHNRWDPELVDELRWEHFVHAAFSIPGMQARGAFLDGQLAAWSLSLLADGWLYSLHLKSRTSALEAFPNYLLEADMLTMAQQEELCAGVICGICPELAQSMPEGLTTFKGRFGYELVQRPQENHLHPLVPRVFSHWPVPTSRPASPRP
jgi:hypothetical protein